MKVSHQQFPSFGNRFLAAYRGEVYQKPRGLPVKASLEGNFRNKYLSRNDFFHLNFKKKSMYLSSSVLFPGSEEGIQTKTKYLKATFYISFALYLDIFTQRFILCLVLFCLMLNEDLYFVALKIYVVQPNLCPVSAFPIHPEGVDSPWTVDFPPDCGYKVKVERGVYQVFRSQEDMDNNKPINYEVNRKMFQSFIAKITRLTTNSTVSRKHNQPRLPQESLVSLKIPRLTQ